MGYTADISMFPYFKNKEGEFEDEDGMISKIMKIKDIEEEIEDAIENHFADFNLRETTHKEWNDMNEENEILKKGNETYEDLLVEKCKMETHNGKMMLKEMEEKSKLLLQIEKFRMEIVSLNEFKEKAEIECEASAVADVFMNEIEELKNEVDRFKKDLEFQKDNYERQKEANNEMGELVFKFITNEHKYFETQCDYIEENMMGSYPFDMIVELMNISVYRDENGFRVAFELYDDDDFDEFIEWEDEDEFNLFAEDYDLDVRYDTVGDELYEYKDDYIDWVSLKNRFHHYRIDRGLGTSLHIIR